MCSMAGERAGTGGGRPSRPVALDRLDAAIEELAAAAQRPDAAAQDVTAGLARLWRMVADLDPELARRLAQYGG
jgi:hypothetical protein